MHLLQVQSTSLFHKMALVNPIWLQLFFRIHLLSIYIGGENPGRSYHFPEETEWFYKSIVFIELQCANNNSLVNLEEKIKT